MRARSKRVLSLRLVICQERISRLIALRATSETAGVKFTKCFPCLLLPATLDDNGLAGLSEGRSARLCGDARQRRPTEDGPRVAGAAVHAVRFW